MCDVSQLAQAQADLPALPQLGSVRAAIACRGAGNFSPGSDGARSGDHRDASRGTHLEVVTAGKEACLVEPGDVDELATALAYLVRDPIERICLGAAARHCYLADFNTVGYGSMASAYLLGSAARQRLGDAPPQP